MTEQDFLKRYALLNKFQKQAVDTIDGPVLVVAGPGSGKTEILSLRVANILRNTDTLPSSILCLTFTDAAQVNMRKRLASLIGPSAYRVGIYTFHSFSKMVIDSYPEIFFGGIDVAPATDAVRYEILNQIFEELSYDDPLNSKHDDGFAYLRDVEQAIGYLKRGAISPKEFHNILEHNQKSSEIIEPILVEALSDRVSKKTLEKVEQAKLRLQKLSDVPDFPVKHFQTLKQAVEDTLTIALESYYKNESSSVFSDLKKRLLKRDDETGEQRFRDNLNSEKLKSFANIFEKYQERIYKAGYYDYDDMVTDVVRAVNINPALRLDLQERFQYILVDEFQDTNDGQMRLVSTLADAPENEGRPNLMAVGDDDQSIYRFQGATLKNILDFNNKYKNPAIITMTENYRSAQPILNLAREIVLRGNERLERILPNFSKELLAKGPHADATLNDAVKLLKYKTFLHECAGIAKEIKQKVEAGDTYNSIAVISREHKNLIDIARVLTSHGIPVRYEQKRNVLEEEHIKMIVTILRFVVTQDDVYLPIILSYPFWGIERESIWRLSVEVKWGEKWLKKMLDSEDSKIVAVAKFMADLSVRAQHEPAERLMDAIIGTHIEYADLDEDNGYNEPTEPQNGFQSPFRQYFFSKQAKSENPQKYLQFLSSLRTFVQSVREHAMGRHLSAKDIVSFVDVHEASKIQLLDKSPFASSVNAVTLQTAHSAKGLEYDTVFVISCTNQSWIGRGRGAKIVLPTNMPLAPSKDSIDDKLKLFYVAITRAKREVYLTYHVSGEDGKDVELLQFLIPEEEGIISSVQHQEENIEDISFELESAHSLYSKNEFADTEKAFLLNLVSNYKLSVTHLNTFLNVTTDLGGPQTFFENNLIRFPQLQSVSAVFGSAVHSVLTDVYGILRREGILPSIEQAFALFESALRLGKLNQNEFQQCREKGEVVIKKYLEEHSDRFDPSHIIELNFSHQDVCVDEVPLSGEIDKIVKNGKEMIVYDFKTGKAPKKGWDAIDQREKIKLHNYHRQLVFYKILIENSRDYGDYEVKKGILEFVEHGPTEPLELSCEITEADKDRLMALIKAVYTKIALLDFPDVSGYDKTIDGIKKFEDDLIAGNI